MIWFGWALWHINHYSIFNAKSSLYIRCAFNRFPDFFVQASKMQSGREDILEERYTIKLCFKLGKNATETYGILQTAFRPSCMNRASVFEWQKRFKEGRESVRDDKRCGGSKEVRTPVLIGQIKNFMDKDRRVSVETISAVVLRQFRRWKRLWRKSLTCSHKKTSMGRSRSCWNGTTSALQPGEITSKGTSNYYQCLLSIKVPIRKSSGNILKAPRICIKRIWY